MAFFFRKILVSRFGFSFSRGYMPMQIFGMSILSALEFIVVIIIGSETIFFSFERHFLEYAARVLVLYVSPANAFVISIRRTCVLSFVTEAT